MVEVTVCVDSKAINYYRIMESTITVIISSFLLLSAVVDSFRFGAVWILSAKTDARSFVGGDGRPFMYGILARIANDEGMVILMFDHVSPLAHFEDIECVDLDGVTTLLSDEDRFELS